MLLGERRSFPPSEAMSKTTTPSSAETSPSEHLTPQSEPPMAQHSSSAKLKLAASDEAAVHSSLVPKLLYVKNQLVSACMSCVSNGFVLSARCVARIVLARNPTEKTIEYERADSSQQHAAVEANRSCAPVIAQAQVHRSCCP